MDQKQKSLTLLEPGRLSSLWRSLQCSSEVCFHFNMVSVIESWINSRHFVIEAFSLFTHDLILEYSLFWVLMNYSSRRSSSTWSSGMIISFFTHHEFLREWWDGHPAKPVGMRIDTKNWFGYGWAYQSEPTEIACNGTVALSSLYSSLAQWLFTEWRCS